MSVIVPLEITDAILTYSSVPEVASPAYDPGATYAVDATASVAGTLGLISEYQSLQAANNGHAPASSPTWWKWLGDTYQVYSGAATYVVGERVIDPVAHWAYESKSAGNIGNALTDDVHWLRIGRTNRWAMFYLQTDQRTIAPSPLTIVLTAGERIDALALRRMVANAVEITETSSGDTVFSESINLNTREVFGYYDYCFAPFSTKPAIVRDNLPPYTNGVITITLTATSGLVEVTPCVIGRHYYIGDIEYSPKIGGKNYSTVSRHFDGSINEMTPRLEIPETRQTLVLKKNRVNSVKKLKSQLNGKIAVWYWLTDTDGYFDLLLVDGFWTSFEFDLAYPEHAKINLTVEEI